MMSLRALLISLLIAVVTLLNFVAAVRGYMGSLQEAERLFDERLSAQIELIHFSLGRQHWRGGEVARWPEFTPEAGHVSADYHTEFQVWQSRDRVLARSIDLPDVPLVANNPGFTEFSHQGYRWRALVHLDPQSQLWYLVAERFDQRYRLAEAVIVRAILPLVLIVPLLAFAIWLIVTLAMRPLAGWVARLQEKDVRDFSPLPEAPLPRELRPLASAVNGLLNRLEQAFNREKRFSADAAHELRTPLAGLQLVAANLRARLQEAEPGAALALVSQLEQSANRMSHLVNQILTLNRTAQEDWVDGFTRVDLAALTKQVLADYYDAIEAKPLELDVDLPQPLILQGNAWALEILLGNLVNNAIKYSPKAGPLQVRAWQDGGHLHWSLADGGPGIDPQLRERVYDRFYRVGGDRHASDIPGCGLGLSIALQIVRLHQGQIHLTTSPWGGLQVNLQFAAAPPEPGP